MRKIFVFLAVLICTLYLPVVSVAYLYTAKLVPFKARAINDLGHVVGHVSNSDGFYAAIWDGSHIVQYTQQSNGLDINNNDDVLIIKNYGTSECIWYDSGVAKDIPIMGYALNNYVQVAGQFDQALPAIWHENSGIIKVSNQSGFLYDINNFGQATGFIGNNAIVWNESDGITYIGPGKGVRINASGQIVGNQYDGEKNIGFLWDPSSGLVKIGMDGNDEVRVIAINDDGLVGGYAKTNHDLYAVIWENGILTNLNDKIINDLRDNDVLVDILDINNRGQILATSLFGKEYLLSPQQQTPIPIPSTLVLFLIGLGGVSCVHKILARL